MGSVRECDEALDEGEEGEGEEGWDDELEAAELASLQECLGDSDMNWTEEEENGDRDDAEVMGGELKEAPLLSISCNAHYHSCCVMP